MGTRIAVILLAAAVGGATAGAGRPAVEGAANIGPETARLRALIGKAYDNQAFGSDVIRGFYVKQIDGPTLAYYGAGAWFQPRSTLKLLPYLYAFGLIDKNPKVIDTPVSWTEATKDDPKTSFDERKYASCLKPGSPGTKSGSAPLRDALPTMMWESHNRTLDAILEKYGPDKITAYAQALGLGSTKMHFGCQQPGGPATPWTANRTTLVDLGKLFAGVDLLQFVKQPSTRQAFLDNMINLDNGGASYTSPITGKKTGPLYNGFLRTLVEREAGPKKKGIVEEFLKGVVLRGKGGGTSGDEFGYSDFLHVTLPFRVGRRTVPKTFVAGWYVDKLKAPVGCPESKAKDGGACEAIWKPERAALEKFRTEIHAAPIRIALKTWPAAP